MLSQNAHYETLIKSNALDNDLARRIEVRRGFLSTGFATWFPLARRSPLHLSCLAQAYKVVAEASQ